VWGYRKGGWRRRGRRLIATLLAVMAGLLVLFVIVERRIEPTLMLIAAQKTDQIAKLAISDAVTKRLTQQGIDFDDIVILEKDSDGNILAVNFNFKQYARIVGETTSRIQARLKEFEEENVVVTVPLGLATKNVFLEHFGPEIPVSFVPVGSVKTRLETGLNGSVDRRQGARLSLQQSRRQTGRTAAAKRFQRHPAVKRLAEYAAETVRRRPPRLCFVCRTGKEKLHQKDQKKHYLSHIHANWQFM